MSNNKNSKTDASYSIYGATHITKRVSDEFSWLLEKDYRSVLYVIIAQIIFIVTCITIQIVCY